MSYSNDLLAWPEAAADRVLAQECRVFTQYLTGGDPDDYVTAKYAAGQRAFHMLAVTGFDAELTRFAASGPVRARIADAYARIFRPRGVLRRKLILTAAILENSAGFHREFTSGGSGGVVAAGIRIAGALAAFALALGAGIVVLGPWHLFGGSSR